jgi:nickel-dependent lactate racemase
VIIPIPYGKTQLELRLPDNLDVTVLEPRDAAPAPDPARAVREAVDSVDWPHFAGARSAAIAINDKTRPVPHDLLLPPLLERLESIGITHERITLIIASGCHTPMTPDEYPGILPADILARYRVISHNVEDEGNIVRLGLTKHKTVVSVNRAYFEANLRLVVGNIEPHQFVGFSGGAKSAVIGLSGWDTINGNHRMMTHANATLGRYDDNPVRQDIEDMGRIVGIHLALNTVLNRQKQIVRVFCGTPAQVMHAAIPLVRQVYELPVEKPFDLIIVSPGGYPKDINIYQAQKALGHAALVSRPGGAIILAAACAEGSGSRKYENWVAKIDPGDDPHQTVIDWFTREGFSVGPHKAYQIARDSLNRRVIWITDLPYPAHFLFEPAPTLDDALSRVLGQYGGRVGVIPYANATIPVLNSSS